MIHLLYSLKSVLEISDDIVNMLSTDRKSDGVGLYACCKEFFLVHL